ncbi:TrkA family potassium uptake protein [Candidatus Villigracilis affinis]|uniref:potassium channel family protein n=1 Tax=Candidatus Villigracilis affinis TaxID=3140682 RepID=UPI002A1B1E55|nr:TrkA family potassium uptake protein [Anaerolineales bacterium]
MKVIIMGCGRVGSQVSLLLARQGHEVIVIDHDTNALSKLGTDFKGRVVRGIGFDRNILIEAGVETAEGFVAASSSDNANIVAARIARNIFRVPRVVARLYDPVRAEVYQRLGLTTISSTAWGAERIVEVVTHNDLDVLNVFSDGGATMIRVESPARLNGHRVAQLNIPGEVSVTAITRSDHTFIPVSGTEFQDGDILYLAVIPSAMNRLEEMLGIERR